MIMWHKLGQGRDPWAHVQWRVLVHKTRSEKKGHEFHETCHSVTFHSFKKDSKRCCDKTTPESIHTKDESKRGAAFAFIFDVNWPVLTVNVTEWQVSLNSCSCFNGLIHCQSLDCFYSYVFYYPFSLCAVGDTSLVMAWHWLQHQSSDVTFKINWGGGIVWLGVWRCYVLTAVKKSKYSVLGAKSMDIGCSVC